MQSSNLGVGVVGTGFIGPVHIEALRRNNIQVIGVAGSNPERANQLAHDLGVAKGYPSFEAMLADPQVEVVHLATPNYLHYPQAKAALTAGKHVVCEKPLAMTSQQAAELVKLARDQQRVNVTHYNLRYYPMVHQARALVQSQQIGEVFIIQGSYLQDWLLFETDWNWRLEPELGGTLRAVADIGSHWLDMLTFVTGLRVEAVMADFKTFLPTRKKPSRPIETFGGTPLEEIETIDQPISTEDFASVLLRYENGARGLVAVSQVSAGRKNRLYFEVGGSRSALAWNSERPNELWIGHRDRANELMMKDPSLLEPEARAITSYPGGHNEGFPDTSKQLYSQVYDYLRKGNFSAKAPFPTFEDGYHGLVLGEAIELSARENRWVEIKE